MFCSTVADRVVRMSRTCVFIFYSVSCFFLCLPNGFLLAIDVRPDVWCRVWCTEMVETRCDVWNKRSPYLCVVDCERREYVLCAGLCMHIIYHCHGCCHRQMMCTSKCYVRYTHWSFRERSCLIICIAHRTHPLCCMAAEAPIPETISIRTYSVAVSFGFFWTYTPNTHTHTHTIQFKTIHYKLARGLETMRRPNKWVREILLLLLYNNEAKVHLTQNNGFNFNYTRTYTSLDAQPHTLKHTCTSTCMGAE